MADETLSITLPEPVETADQLDSEGEAKAVIVEFEVPGRGYVVPRGAQFRSTTFVENLVAAELEYYDTNSHNYMKSDYQGDVNPLVFTPGSSLRRSRNAIHYRLYGNGKWSGWMDTGWFHVAEPVEITAPPSGSIFTTTPSFSGTGDSGHSGWVEIRRASDNARLGDRINVPGNDRWSLSLYDSLSTGFYEVYAAGGGPYWQVESRSLPRTIIILRAPTVTSPTLNTVVAQTFTLTGKALPGARVDLAHPGGVSVKLDIPVDGNGNWTTTLERSNAQANAELVFSAWQRYGTGTSNWLAPDHKLLVLGAPSITSHNQNQEVEMQITVGGTVNALFKGGTIQIRRDVAGTVLGTGSVNSITGTWEVPLNVSLIPGSYSLTAVHVFSGVTSVGASTLRLRVRPSQATIRSTLNGETVTLSGTGYNGADVRMDIHFSGDPTPYLDAIVSGGNWSKVIPADLLPGNYRFGGRQSVSDGGSGRIYSSDWILREITVNIPTPIPTSVTVSVSGQRATFRGRGNQWRTNAVEVSIFSNGEILANVPKANVQTSLNWETSATADLPPGNYAQLTARQRVNNQWSANSTVFSMTVACPPPSFFEPVTPSGQRPRISGTAWPGSQVILRIPGKPDVPLTANNSGNFERNAAEEWAPATYTLTATAAFGGRTSTVASRTFTVKTPQPGITTAANAEVDLVPIIEGTGYPGCWVVIYSNTTHQSIGAGAVNQDKKWQVTLVDQVPGNLSFYAVQQETRDSNNHSDRTTPRTVKVRVPKPRITVPVQNGRPARVSQFSGEGQFPGFVELSIKGQNTPLLKDIEVKADGTWQVQVTLPAGGPVTLEARQRQRGYASDALERVVTVVPAIPSVDTPRAGENLGRELRISGFGFAGDTILIYRRGSVSSTLTQTPVLADGTWSATVAHNLLATDGINVLASAGQGLNSALSPVVTYTLLGTRPSLTEPLSGDWVGVRPLFSGLATPGATITVASWSNAADVLAPAAIADTDGRWSVVGNKDLPEGPMRVVVSQNFNGVRSEGFESARFIVERKTAGFEAPSVNYPLAGQSVGRYPMFSGSGEPGAEVLIVKEGSVATELGRTRVGRDGRWALHSQIQLPVSATPYVYSVRQSRDGAVSAWLLPHRSLVVTQVGAEFEKPFIDEPTDDGNQILESQPLLAGRGVPGAGIYFKYDDEETQLAATQVNADGKWSVRTRVPLLPREAPYRISARHGMDGQVSQWSSTTSFKVDDRLALFVVSSPQRGAGVSPRAVFRGTAMPGGEVRLYQWGYPARIWGRGIADAQGQWVIVTEALPLGRFVMGGRLYKGTVVSPALPEFELNVIDAG
jgi:hypothetical protein